MLERNTRIIVSVLIASVFLAAIPMDWLTTSTAGSEVTITGSTGRIIAPLVASLPIWLFLSGSAALTLVAGLNSIRATAIPFAPLASALTAGGVYYAIPFLVRDEPMQQMSVSVGAGPFVALAATFAATLLALRQPLPGPTTRRPNHALSRTAFGHR